MTWSTPVSGVRHWNHKTFTEPSDAELEEYGWTKPTISEEQQARYGKHVCLRCPKLVHRQAKHCMACFKALRRENAAEQPHHLYEVDEFTVQRVLNGEWRLKTTKAEKVAICERWAGRGGAMIELGRLTGWRTERYLTLKRRAA